MQGAATIGIDLGTSSVKVAAVALTSEVLAEATAEFPTCRDRPGQAEQDPRLWMEAIAVATRAVARRINTAGVCGIGLTGQMPTLVRHLRSGETPPAITWQDSRADAWVAERLTEITRAAMYCVTGMPIDGRYLAPMLRHHFADRGGDIARVMSAKDAVCHALTGRHVTDPSTAAGYGVYALESGQWDHDLVGFWGLDPGLLPPIARPDDIAGPLLAEAASRIGLPPGTPVCVGAADSVCGALALAGCVEGTACVSWGSSTVIIDAAPRIRLDPQRRCLVTPLAADGWFGREMDLLASGTGHRWLRGIMGWGDRDLEALAVTAPAGANGLLFAPYLGDGEQGALWNPDLRGVLHGLSLRHQRGDIARAFLEGSIYEVRRCLDVLAEESPPQRIVLAGHPAGSPFVVQLMADILDRDVIPVRNASAAACGAALLARPDPPARRGPLAAPALHPARPGPDAAGYAGLRDRYFNLFPMAACASHPPSDTCGSPGRISPQTGVGHAENA